MSKVEVILNGSALNVEYINDQSGLKILGATHREIDMSDLIISLGFWGKLEELVKEKL